MWAHVTACSVALTTNSHTAVNNVVLLDSYCIDIQVTSDGHCLKELRSAFISWIENLVMHRNYVLPHTMSWAEGIVRCIDGYQWSLDPCYSPSVVGITIILFYRWILEHLYCYIPVKFLYCAHLCVCVNACMTYRLPSTTLTSNWQALLGFVQQSKSLIMHKVCFYLTI